MFASFSSFCLLSTSPSVQTMISFPSDLYFSIRSNTFWLNVHVSLSNNVPSQSTKTPSNLFPSTETLSFANA